MDIVLFIILQLIHSFNQEYSRSEKFAEMSETARPVEGVLHLFGSIL